MVEDLFKNLTCPSEFAEAILEKLKDMLQGKQEYEQETLDAIQKKISVLKKRLKKLYIDKIDETISEEFYFEKKNEWQIELDEARMQFDFISQENDEIIQKATEHFSHCAKTHTVLIFQEIYCKNVPY